MKIQYKTAFSTICGNVVANNRAFENNIRFLEQFSRFRGGGDFTGFPLAGANEYKIVLFKNWKMQTIENLSASLYPEIISEQSNQLELKAVS